MERENERYLQTNHPSVQMVNTQLYTMFVVLLLRQPNSGKADHEYVIRLATVKYSTMDD